MAVKLVAATLIVAATAGSLTVRAVDRDVKKPTAKTLVTAQCLYRDGGRLPDPACTPGATNPAVTQRTIGKTICTHGWTATVRPDVSLTEPRKFQSMRAYGDSTAPGQAKLYEYDHLIPLELGGATLDTRNLWPELRSLPDGHDGRAKDRTENRLHVLVCAHAMKLAAARKLIRTDWTAAP